jgi:23S rRNA (cytosine1962-C5)-methyltransferase
MSEKETDYDLLDSGDGRRLERFGALVLDRPAPQAFWKPYLPPAEWAKADGYYHRSSSGGGEWDAKKRLPESWPCHIDGIRYTLKPTGFGHVGVFPEQWDNWRLIERRILARSSDMDVLNVFGYTGAATLVALRAGARVCHLDASKGVVQWAREMAEDNGLSDRSVRWMVEDAAKYLRREFNRGRRYHGILLDPPSFGRGNKGEVWKIEEGVSELLDLTIQLLADDADFLLLSTNSPKFTPLVLANLLSDALGERPGVIEAEEMTNIERHRARRMPNGVTARWLATNGNKTP